MPNLIYLGNYNSVDTSENNWASEGAQSLVGISANSSQMDIVNANVSDGGDGVVSDDDYGTNDYVQYYIDGQYFCTKTDSTMTANVTLTLSDGSTQVVEVVMMQQQNGDLFISDLLNCGTLDNLSIANVEISAITGDCYSGWYSDQSVDNTTLAPVTPNNDGYVDGTAGDDVIDGSYVDQDGDRVDANDQILPGAGEDDDYIRAGAGNDFVLAGDGDDEVYGGTGDDTLCGNDGDDTLFGEAGNDTLEGMNGNDIVYGGAGDDRITGDAGDDVLNGGSGDDSISGGTGNDVIYGDRNGEDETTVAGRESFNWEGRSDSEIDGGYAMNTGSVTVTYDRIQDTGSHQSSLGNATLNTTGINSGGETVDNDSSLRSETDGCGNEGAFSWDFSAPVENVSFNVNDIDGDGVVRILAYDANGNQIPVVLTGGNRLTLLDTDSVAGADTADSNGGYDDTNTSGYNLNVSIQGPVSRIVLEHDQDGNNNSGINVTDIYFDSTDATGGNGADGNDVIAGGAGEDLIYGEGGDDSISGGADDDTVYGGAGDDSISGNNGDDFLLGGDGDDNINGGNGDDTLCGNDGDDVLTGGAGNDILEGMNDNDVLFGGAGDDRIYGDAGNDEAHGGDGDDSIYGGSGDDNLNGDAGNDLINAGSGDDMVSGGAGDDSISGGAGDDVLCGDDEDTSIGRVDELTLQWNEVAPVGTGLAATQTYAVGGMNVTVGFDQQDQGATGQISNTQMYVEGGENFDPNSGLYLYGLGGEGGVDNTSTTSLTFASDDAAYGDEVQDVSFRINDIDNGTNADDHIDIVTVRAYDADGNEVPVTITAESGAQIINGNTVTGGVEHSAGVTPASQLGSVLYNVEGPVARIEIDYDNGESTDQRIDVTDINFFTTPSAPIPGEAGNDVISGGDGDDDIYGKAGDDTLSGDAGNDNIFGGADRDVILGGAGDNVDGGAGGDDYDILDVTGQGTFILTGPDGTGDPIPDSNGNGFDGQVVFVDANGNPTGEVIDFVEIEEIRGDQANAGPIATDDAFTGTEDDPSQIVGNVITGDTGSGTDTDPDGDTLTVSEVNGDPAGVGQPVAGSDGGLVTINPDGTVSFDPNGEFDELGEGEEATTTVTYTVTDPDGAESTATVTFTVTGTNDAPTAVADVFTADEDDITDLGNVVDANDTDPENDDLTVAAVNGDPANVGQPVAGDNGGLVTINEDGTASFDPNGEFEALGEGEEATTEVTYTITDPDGATSTTTVTVTVTGVNDGPVAVDSSYTVSATEAAGDVDGNAITDDTGEGVDSDPEDDALTVVAVDGSDANVGNVVAGDNGGLFTINADGSIDFDANGEFDALGDGETATTTVSYTIADEDGLESTANVTFTVSGTNDGPVATNDAFDAGEDDPDAVLGNVLGNDTDPDGDTLTVSEVNGDPAGVGQPVAGSDGGLVTINPDGTVSFDPNGEFDELGEGEEATTTVTYTVTDPDGAESTATVTFTVTGTNDAPTAVADVFTADEDDTTDLGNVVDANDTDPENDDLTVAAVNGDPANVGQPVAGDNGGLVTINEDGTASFDPNGEFEALGEGEEATTEVTYTITDPDGATSTTTVTVTVTGVNDGPVAVDSSYTVSATEAAGDVDGNAITDDTGEGVDSDPEDDALTVVAVDGSDANVGNVVAGDNGGLFTINADGSIDFDANGEFDALGDGETATTTVSYTIADEDGLESTANVTFTVSGTNDGPVATNDAFDAGEDDPDAVLGNVLGNDTDPDGDTLTVSEVNGDPAGVGQPVAGSDGGLVTINPDGTVSFDPNGEFDELGEGEEATTTVTYTVTDPDGAESTATVTFTVTGTNDAPTAVADVFTADEDDITDLGNVVDANDTDPENDDLTVAAVNGDPANVGQPVAGDNGGLVTINEDGTASFDPNGEFEALGEGEEATTEVTYTITDPDGATSTTTVTVTVTGTNDAPTAVADTFDADETDPTDLGNVLGNDIDPEDDPLTVSQVNGDPTLVGTPVPADGGGLVTINEDGSISFDPNGEFEELGEGETADVTVTYTATDPDGETSSTTVTITVNGVNDGPVATDNAYVVTLTEAAGDVDGNVITDNTGDGVDSDPENDDLTVVAVGGSAAGVSTPVAGDNGGLFTINPDGTVDFDTNGDFDGLGLNATEETSVTYTIRDENGLEDTATVTFTVTGTNDGTVQGTAGDDVINPDIPYVDADGDIVDAGDAILPGDVGDDDLIYGFDGNDSIDAGNGDDEVYGGTGNDTIEGGDGDDWVSGGTGNDVVDGGDGNDTLNGNQGDDTINGGDGDDVVNGGLGDDSIEGGAGDDVLNGEDGDDTIRGGAGDDMVNGGEGDDDLYGGVGNDKIEGSEGDDTLTGGSGDDDIWGGLDDDTLYGGSGDDTLGGGAGNDVIEDNIGNDVVEGGDGDDVINVGNTVNPALDYDYGSIPFGDNDAAPNNDLDTVFGGAGNDIISTGDDADSIDGGEGDDIIDAGIDDDSVTGGTGNDTIIGGQGEDIIEGNEGDDLIYGGLEDEVLTLPDAIDEAPDDNRDTIYGGLGNDTIFGRDDADTLYGGEGNDILDGGIDDDEIWGDDGDDTIYGGQGNDVINGGVGQDLIYGGEGDDTIQGNMDDDAIYGDEGNDTITGSLDDDLVYGGADDDEIRGGTGDDTLHGDEGDDFIQGGYGDDSIYGGDGEDSLNGGFGADIIEGGDGNDTIAGFDGEDTITGGAGEDTLYGGQNSDVFLGGNGGDVVKGGEDPDDSDVDVLDLTGSNVDFITYTDGDPESGVVTFLDGSTMTFSEIENVIPCFTPGTTIATAKGERLVEELVEGDRIITRDNGIQEIAWVGHKEMTGKQLVQNPHLKPILIKAGALGNGLPERDMMVSPNHRVLVASELTQLYFEENEVLAAAKHMVGADGIHAVDVMSTTYVHFMFERHEVVLSNGAWTESFQPGDYSLKGIGNSQRNEIMELFPELNTKTGLEGYQSARKALKKHEAKLLIK